jgi:hypothetical protein
MTSECSSLATPANSKPRGAKEGAAWMTSAKVPNVKGVRLGHLNRRPAWPELNVRRLDRPTVMRETCREDEADHANHRDEGGEDHT